MKKWIGMLALLALITGCSDPQAFDGPGSNQDVAYLKDTWGVVLPGGNPTLLKHADGLMVYLVPHEKLDEIKTQVQRAWRPLGPKNKFENKQFCVDGAVDTKVEYAEWSETAGTRKVVCLDRSTGTATFFVFP
jgi:hypothetical protein